MELWHLFTVALMPVLKALLITAVGMVLATERQDIMGMDARMHLNNLVFYVLNPALVGSNLAKFITLKSIVQLWFTPVSILITFIAGSALGWLLLKITRAPNRLRGLILGCCAAVGFYHFWLMEAKQDGLIEGMESARETPENLSNRGTGPLLPLKETSHNEGMEHFELDPAVLSEGKPKVPFPENIKQGFQKVQKKLHLKTVFSPSINGAGVSMTIATLIVGANLLKGFKGSKVPILVIIGISAVRYIFMPILGVLTIKYAAHFGLGNADPRYKFVLLLQFALPPAINIGLSTIIGTMTQFVWSWRNRMLGDHAMDLFLCRSCSNALVSILHVVR